MLRRILFMADAPAGGGGTPPPAEPPAGDMVDNIMAELNAGGPPEPPAAPTPPPEPPKGAPAAPPPAEPPKPAPSTPPEPKPAPAAKPAGATPPPEKALDWKTAPVQFRTAHEKLKQEFDRQTGELNTKLQTTEQKMRELEGREYLTPEQREQYKRLETRQQELEKDLYARDYRESPEFKSKYQSRADKVFAQVQKNIGALTVNDGNESRVATMADFVRVRSLSDSVVEQRKLAKQLFGEDADVVLGFAREISSIEDAANEEIEAKKAEWTKERETRDQRQQTERQSVERAYQSFDQQLSQKYFKTIDGNPEYNKALEEGLKFVDANNAGFNQKTPEQRAQTAALVRRLAAAWPAAQVLLKQKDTKITELEAIVRKLQGSDPGAGGDGGGSAPAGGEDSGGTDTLADEIKKLQQQG